jgi:hypothetical protein
MKLRLTLAFVALGTLLMVSQARAQQYGRILLGALEDHPGNYYGQPYFRAVRVVFEKVGTEWRAFPSACPNQECLKTISSRYPSKVSWTIGLHGKMLGSVTGRTYAEFPFYDEVGLQKIISRGPVPTVGKRSEEYGADSGYSGYSVYRPLVANSQPYLEDPQDWRRTHFSPKLVASLRQRFREKFPHVENCRNPYENTGRPWPYGDENIKVIGAFTSNGGWRLAGLELGPYRCDGPVDPEFDDWWIVVPPNGNSTFIGSDLVFVDSGDFGNDGDSEMLFQVVGKNLGGYTLFYDHFRKHVSFTFNYH